MINRRVIPIYTLEVIRNPTRMLWEYMCALCDTEDQCIVLAQTISCIVPYSRIYTLREHHGVMLQYVVGVYHKGKYNDYIDDKSDRLLKCGWVF